MFREGYYRGNAKASKMKGTMVMEKIISDDFEEYYKKTSKDIDIDMILKIAGL